MNDYSSRRSSCLLESIERLYQSSFIFYTGPQSHYTQRKLGQKAPEWLQKSHGKSKLNLKENNEETSAEGKQRYRKALQSGIAKEFGRDVRQQQTRGKTKERAGTLSLALSYVQKECVGTWRSRFVDRGSRE